MPRVYDCCEDIEYLKSLEEERIELVGPDAEYYSLNRGKNVDAVYGEPVNDPLYGGSDPRGTPSTDEHSWNFYPNIPDGEPLLTMPVVLEYQEFDNRNPMVREEGFFAEYDAIMSMSRNHWEKAIEGTSIDGRRPKEGDVVYVYNEWWDIVRVGAQGFIMATPEFVGYRFELRKRTKFTPDRKVD